MNEWLKSFAGWMLAVSVAVKMVPDGKYVQYVRLFAGLLLILLLLEPLWKIGSMDQIMEEKIELFLDEQQEIEQQLPEDYEEIEEVVVEEISVEVDGG